MKKALVAYFSAGGTTAKAATVLKNAISADLYEIRPAVPYSRADLDWTDAGSRSSVEKAPSSRPELADTAANIADYDTVFVGFPIWWYTAPAIIKTFLEAYDFTGKVIVPFATSGGSSLGSTAHTLQACVPGAKVVDGRMLNGHLRAEDLRKWAESIEV